MMGTDSSYGAIATGAKGLLGRSPFGFDEHAGFEVRGAAPEQQDIGTHNSNEMRYHDTFPAFVANHGPESRQFDRGPPTLSQDHERDNVGRVAYRMSDSAFLVDTLPAPSHQPQYHGSHNFPSPEYPSSWSGSSDSSSLPSVVEIRASVSTEIASIPTEVCVHSIEWPLPSECQPPDYGSLAQLSPDSEYLSGEYASSWSDYVLTEPETSASHSPSTAGEASSTSTDSLGHSMERMERPVPLQNHWQPASYGSHAHLESPEYAPDFIGELDQYGQMTTYHDVTDYREPHAMAYTFPCDPSIANPAPMPEPSAAHATTLLVPHQQPAWATTSYEGSYGTDGQRGTVMANSDSYKVEIESVFGCAPWSNAF
jgi:hypothetical protein